MNQHFLVEAAALSLVQALKPDVLLESTEDGRFQRFGPEPGLIRKTIIRLPSGIEIETSRSSAGEGILVALFRFSKLEVRRRGEILLALDIRIEPDTSFYNPGYRFFRNEESVGVGYGQMDTYLAREFLENVSYPPDSGYVDEEVLKLIKSFL